MLYYYTLFSPHKVCLFVSHTSKMTSNCKYGFQWCTAPLENEWVVFVQNDNHGKDVVCCHVCGNHNSKQYSWKHCYPDGKKGKNNIELRLCLICNANISTSVILGMWPLVKAIQHNDLRFGPTDTSIINLNQAFRLFTSPQNKKQKH